MKFNRQHAPVVEEVKTAPSFEGSFLGKGHMPVILTIIICLIVIVIILELYIHFKTKTLKKTEVKTKEEADKKAIQKGLAIMTSPMSKVKPVSKERLKDIVNHVDSPYKKAEKGIERRLFLKKLLKEGIPVAKVKDTPGKGKNRLLKLNEKGELFFHTESFKLVRLFTSVTTWSLASIISCEAGEPEENNEIWLQVEETSKTKKSDNTVGGVSGCTFEYIRLGVKDAEERKNMILAFNDLTSIIKQHPQTVYGEIDSILNGTADLPPTPKSTAKTTAEYMHSTNSPPVTPGKEYTKSSKARAHSNQSTVGTNPVTPTNERASQLLAGYGNLSKPQGSHHTSNANHRTRKIDDIFVLHSITPVSGDYDLDTKWNDATNIDLETAYEKEGFASILPTTQASKGEMVRLLSRKYKMARRTRDGQPLVHVDHDNFYQQLHDIYAIYNPERIGSIHEIMEAYKNKEAYLLEELHSRYNISEDHHELLGHGKHKSVPSIQAQ